MAAESTHHTIRRAAARPGGWCCSFAGVPQSPEHRALPTSAVGGGGVQKLPPKSPLAPSSKLAGLIDPRRILSPGRVSPIDHEGSSEPAVAVAVVGEEEMAPRDQAPPFVAVREDDEEEEIKGLDLRLCLRGRDGRCVVMELDSTVLCESSAFFAGMVPDASGGAKRIEVDGVDNLAAFKDAVELMFEPDAMRWLARAGVSRAIGVLEVSTSITFSRGIESCLKYIEAAPWSENDEEKLKNVFARCTFDEAIPKDMLARLQSPCKSSSEDLTIQLVKSVTCGTNNGARKEMQSLISGLLSKSSVYQKDLSGLNKGSLYEICRFCFSSLVEIFKEESQPLEHENQTIAPYSKPLIERVHKQTENLNWLFDILLNNDMAEEFVEMWAKHADLIRMHEQASPMLRYELSRISASVFIALGKGRIQCPSDLRSQLFHGWFRPMLMDFGWLQRCPKGLDVRTLEENLGQAILTLPLRQQQSLFEQWFRSFASIGTECPNLSRAFQVWWRRSFVRSSYFQVWWRRSFVRSSGTASAELEQWRRRVPLEASRLLVARWRRACSGSRQPSWGSL